MEQLYKKILYKQSLYDEAFIYGIVKIEKYLNRRFDSSMIKSKKTREKEQYIMALDYFCKCKTPIINNNKDLKNKPKIKEVVYDLMKLFPDEYDFELDMNQKVDLLNTILLNGQFELRVLLLLVFQIINNKILKENSKEINSINNAFDSLINKEHKFLINYFLTIYKSLEKFLNDLVDEYVLNKLPENNSTKVEYNKFSYFFQITKIIDDNEEGKEIQKIYHNWNLIKYEFEKTGVFYRFLSEAEAINYPKSVINLIEKYVFDITRLYNLHTFANEDIYKNENKKILKYLKLYYKSYIDIDDNNNIFDHYFNNNQLFSLISINNKQKNIINKGNQNLIYVDAFINDINKYLIDLNKSILLSNINLIEKIENTVNNNTNIIK